MRLLLKDNKDFETLSVQEFTGVYFDLDAETLGFTGIDGEAYIVNGITKEETNKICKEILSTGFYDLSSYEEFEKFDEYKYI